MKHFKNPGTNFEQKTRQPANEDLPPFGRDVLFLAKKIAALRCDRAHFLSARLLGEPGYDMALAMFIASIEDRAIHAHDLTLAAGVPQSTGLRWIRACEELV